MLLTHRLTLAVAGLAVVTGSLTVPWARTGFGTERELLGAGSVPMLSGTVAVLAVLTALLLAADAIRKSSFLRPIAMVSAATGAVILGVWITSLEMLAAVTLDKFLPETIYRISVEFTAGIGSWIALIGLSIQCAGALLHKPIRIPTLRIALGWIRSPRFWGVVGMVAFAGIAAWLRDEPWLIVTGADQSVELVGWSVPWVGPLTLFANWMVLVALASFVLGRRAGAAMIGATAGWLISFSAALTVLFTDALSRTGLQRLGEEQIGEFAPDYIRAASVWWSFGLGIAVATSAALLLVDRATTIDDS